MLGFGSGQLHDEVGAVDVERREGSGCADRQSSSWRASSAARDLPTIVCAQAGNVNGGAFDGTPMPAIADAVDAGAPCARPSPGSTSTRLRPVGAGQLAAAAELAADAERADSWATDAHKWLNTPYDCGIALTRHAEAHRRAMSGAAAYLPESDPEVPSALRLRAGAVAPRPAGSPCGPRCRQLGTQPGSPRWSIAPATWPSGWRPGSRTIPGVEVMNEVALNQLVVRFRDPAAGWTTTGTRGRWRRGW